MYKAVVATFNFFDNKLQQEIVEVEKQDDEPEDEKELRAELFYTFDGILSGAEGFNG